MRFRVLTCLALVALAAFALEASQPQFWKIEGARAFLDGTLEGLSVDSDGRVRLAPAVKTLFDTDAPHVWCIARSPKGSVFAGTGNDGKVFEIENGNGALFFDAPELEIHALAFGPDGRLYVAASPDGKVYAVDAKGKSEVYFDPPDRYIWALAFDGSGRLHVATGADGHVYRVSGPGKSTTVLTSTDTHVTSLALDASGHVFAGSSPGGVVYRVDPAGKVLVLHDSSFREVKALDVGRDGSLYGALVEAQAKEETTQPGPAQPSVITSAAPVGEVTVTESFSLLPGAAPIPTGPQPLKVDTARAGAPKGAVIRIAPTGEVDTLWSSPEEMPLALIAPSDGLVVATGSKGQVFRIRDDRTWTMVAKLPAQQVTGLLRGDRGGFHVSTSNPGRVHALLEANAKGSFVSKPHDSETVSRWGRLRFDAEVPGGTSLKIETRSGNTTTPDDTWSDWSPSLSLPAGESVVSPPARFLQVRALFEGDPGKSPVLSAVAAAFLQRNLRPAVTSITIHPPGEVFQKPISLTGEAEILGLESQGPDLRPQALAAKAALPPATTYSRKMYQRGLQTVSWKAEDPNGDTLTYDVEYRLVSEQRFKPLRQALGEAVLAWDTTALPNGRYVIRITASDGATNPEEMTLTASEESTPFEVDNMPPSVGASLVQAGTRRIRVTARDDASPLKRAEYAVDGGRWQDVHPRDGISDGLEETYEFTPAGLAAGSHIVVVRVTDLLGNSATARIEVP